MLCIYIYIYTHVHDVYKTDVLGTSMVSFYMFGIIICRLEGCHSMYVKYFNRLCIVTLA